MKICPIQNQKRITKIQKTVRVWNFNKGQSSIDRILFLPSRNMPMLCRSIRAIHHYKCRGRTPVPYQLRTHMGHGGNLGGLTKQATLPGPRSPLPIGLPAAEATQNILRLLETASQNLPESLKGIWHGEGSVLERNHDGSRWCSHEPVDYFSQNATDSSPIQICSIRFSDDRTALVETCRGRRHSCYSLLRLDEDISGATYYNGWTIVRQLNQSPLSSAAGTFPTDPSSSLPALHATLQRYLSIEHGGGLKDAEYADKSLLSPHASLLTVGIGSLDDEPSLWSAPAGSFLEIERATYIDGIRSQSPPHSPAAAQHDAIVAVAVLPCQTAAAATVRVGNGARTFVFEDHLLLGWSESCGWQIQSKTFSAQPWPKHA